MKEYAVATLIFLGGSGIIAQAATAKNNLVSNVDITNIQVKENAINLNVSYPGPSISGICGI